MEEIKKYEVLVQGEGEGGRGGAGENGPVGLPRHVDRDATHK